MKQLKTLTCFNHIETIVPIVAGLSSQCYQVHADNELFFAKQISTTRETATSLHAALQSISPKVIFHDHHWLITQYIDGENLAFSQQTLDEKILIAIELMSKCHQITDKPVELAPRNITHELISNKDFSSQQQAEFTRVANQLTFQLKQTNNLVCCHGDLNFSNILITPSNSTYLVDFECACAAPAEYDLAMFIAVNNIKEDKIPSIIEHYTKNSFIEVNPALLNRYLLFCYFINGLWYTCAYNKSHLAKFTLLAKQQWQNIHGLNLLNFCQ